MKNIFFILDKEREEKVTTVKSEADRKLTRAVAVNAFGESIVREAENCYFTGADENFWNDLSDENKLQYIVNAWLKAGKKLQSYQRIVKALVGEGSLVF